MNVTEDAPNTVLYVDDEPEVLRAFERDLRPWLTRKNIRIETASSGSACMEKLDDRAGRVDLVVSDLRMPEIPGSDLLLEISERYPDIGLVLLTAYTDMDEINRAVSASILGLLQKPWDPEILAGELERFLEYTRVRRDNKRYVNQIQEQLQIAGEFQQAFLRYDRPDESCLEVDVLSRPAPGMYVNGDYFDVIVLDRFRTLMLVGDVSGHGIKPSFVTAVLKLLSREHARAQPLETFSTGRFFTALNEALVERLPEISDIFVSCVAVFVDLQSGTAVHANAGHPHAFFMRGTRAITSGEVGPALGFDGAIRYTDSVLNLELNDRIVLFTDGLFDDRQLKKSQFDKERLASIFVQAGRSPSGGFVEVLERLLMADLLLDRESKDLQFHDDLTIVSAEVLKLGHG